jgi:DHA2 family multidrug resistance protein-like MFS transporter
MFLDPQQRTFAIGLWITSYSVGGALGPVLGGILLEYFWWGSVFLLGVPVMVLLLLVGPVLLPEYRDPAAGRLDPLSAALSLAAVLGVIWGLKQIAQDGVDWLPVVSIVAGIILGTVFLRRQRTLADPLVDLRLFRNRAFTASLATYMLGTFVAFGAFLFTAQYLQLVLGLSPLKAGLWMLPLFLSFVVGSMLTPLIVRRVRPAYAVAGGLVVAGLGFGLLTQIDETSGLTLLVTGSIIYSLGLAPVFTLATDMIVGAAPPERAGSAAAISETSSEFGGALGIAIFGSIGTAVYRARMADLASANLPHEVAEALRGTLGGAVAVAGRLPGDLGAQVLGTAREAFTQALAVTTAISAFLAIAAGVMVIMSFRGGPSLRSG